MAASSSSSSSRRRCAAVTPALRCAMKSMVRYTDNASSSVEPVTITARICLMPLLSHSATSITRGITTNRLRIFIVSVSVIGVVLCKIYECEDYYECASQEPHAVALYVSALHRAHQVAQFLCGCCQQVHRCVYHIAVEPGDGTAYAVEYNLLGYGRFTKNSQSVILVNNNDHKIHLLFFCCYPFNNSFSNSSFAFFHSASASLRKVLAFLLRCIISVAISSCTDFSGSGILTLFKVSIFTPA